MSGRGADGASGTISPDLADQLREVNERLVLTSIREQEASETAERERQRLRALLEALHEGVVIIEGGDRIVMVNEAARRAMGIAHDEGVELATLPGLDFRRLDTTSLPAGQQPFVRALHHEAFSDVELLLVRPDATVRQVFASCTTTESRLHDDDDVALSIVVLRDVTDRRRLESRLAKTEHLAAIGKLTGGVAHEVNNPLACVVSNIELAIEDLRAQRHPGGGDPGGLEGLLLEAQHGAARIRTIIAELQAFARGEAPSDDRARLAAASEPLVTVARRGAILVVDDEPSIGVVLRRVLRDHDVTFVTNADAALALVLAGSVFDVIISDLMMPQKTGMDLHAELTRHSPKHVERMVFMSGGAFTPAAAEFLARVANERLQKPFDAETVRSLVQKLITPRFGS